MRLFSAEKSRMTKTEPSASICLRSPFSSIHCPLNSCAEADEGDRSGLHYDCPFSSCWITTVRHVRDCVCYQSIIYAHTQTPRAQYQTPFCLILITALPTGTIRDVTQSQNGRESRGRESERRWRSVHLWTQRGNQLCPNEKGVTSTQALTKTDFSSSTSIQPIPITSQLPDSSTSTQTKSRTWLSQLYMPWIRQEQEVGGSKPMTLPTLNCFTSCKSILCYYLR